MFKKFNLKRNSDKDYFFPIRTIFKLIIMNMLNRNRENILGTQYDDFPHPHHSASALVNFMLVITTALN